MTETIWSLPGLSRLPGSIAEAQVAGASCAVAVPVPHRTNTEWVYGFIEATGMAVELVEPVGDRPPAAVVADHYGVKWRAGEGAASDLAKSLTGYSGSILGVALHPGDAAWSEFVAAFLAALPGVPPLERPQLVVFCGASDMSLIRERRVHVQEKWWWGSVSRLDTIVHAGRALGDRSDPLAVSQITEVCGFDLDLVEILAQEWDGGHASLVELVETRSDSRTTHPEWTTLQPRSTVLACPPRFHKDWELGLVNAWERYDPFVSPLALPAEIQSESLHTRLWRGQLRELMPMVDAERVRLEAWARAGELSTPHVSFPIEIGQLVKLLYEDPALFKRATPTRRSAAKWLRETRNRLAHRDIIDPAEVARGLSLLDEDRASRPAP